ncbi:MAG: YjbQ family protein [Ruminococcaceae bacterium]|nr:YjbQ family protein [Oscillospiraceae bacterium]
MANVYEYTLKTDARGFYNITAQVSGAIEQSGVENGIALVFCPHTTAAVTITENTDPAVGEDILNGMTEAFPKLDNFLHVEGNSHAYMRSCNMGCQLSVIVDNGWMVLGTWQNLFFVEFDGPRERTYYVKVYEC